MKSISEIFPVLPMVQALFFTVLFLLVRKRLFAIRYLLAFMGLNFLCLFSEHLAYEAEFYVSVYSYYVSLPLQLAAVPFLYFYFAGLTIKDFRLKNNHLIHFIPGLALLIFNLIVFTSIPFAERLGLVEISLSSANFSNSLILYIRTYEFVQVHFYNVQIVFYSALIIYLIIRHRKRLENYFSYREKISLAWAPFLIALVLFMTVIEFNAYYSVLKEGLTNYYSLLFFVFLSFLGYFAFWQGDIYFHDDNDKYNEDNEKFTEMDHIISEEEKRNSPFYASEGEITANESDAELEKFEKQDNQIPEDEIIQLVKKLERIMVENRPYINSKLTLDDLAGKINIHKNLLSRLINQHYNMNFFHFINKYRISAAKKMLEDPNSIYLSIDGIAISVGFNSKSVFYPAFKKEMKQTPLEYRKKFI
jgi:AraC-like DNA-binding protein